MSEKQFALDKVEKENAILSVKITDSTTDDNYFIMTKEAYEDDIDEIVDCLNRQQATINKLKEENDKLRALIKGKVFGRYREGSLADMEFKATAYDDIVKVEMSYESEPKVIVICKQGKKENVKSFCQMFIPFGVYYEIKEIIE